MEKEQLIYGVIATIIIGGAIMKILHFPYANLVLQVGVFSALLYQAWYVAYLKKKIRILESKR